MPDPTTPRMGAVDIAREFHETYERLAPSFGYETRKDTRAFDPESPNGRLMTAVCGEVSEALREQVAEERSRADKLAEENERLREERDEYAATFDLQHKRMNEAVALWRKATGKHEILPDLGDLLAWLMQRAADAGAAEIAALRARVAELERVIAEAPHAHDCTSRPERINAQPCDCWKKASVR